MATLHDVTVGAFAPLRAQNNSNLRIQRTCAFWTAPSSLAPFLADPSLFDNIFTGVVNIQSVRDAAAARATALIASFPMLQLHQWDDESNRPEPLLAANFAFFQVGQDLETRKSDWKVTWTMYSLALATGFKSVAPWVKQGWYEVPFFNSTFVGNAYYDAGYVTLARPSLDMDLYWSQPNPDTGSNQAGVDFVSPPFYVPTDGGVSAAAPSAIDVTVRGADAFFRAFQPSSVVKVAPEIWYMKHDGVTSYGGPLLTRLEFFGLARTASQAADDIFLFGNLPSAAELQRVRDVHTIFQSGICDTGYSFGTYPVFSNQAPSTPWQG